MTINEPLGPGSYFFEGFELSATKLDGVSVRFRGAGSGPPLLLLHGHPQTNAMWHAVAPRLAQELTVILPDLLRRKLEATIRSSARHVLKARDGS